MSFAESLRLFNETATAIAQLALPVVVLYLVGFRYFKLISERMSKVKWQAGIGSLSLTLPEPPSAAPPMKVEANTSNIAWQKTGALWWLCSDMVTAGAFVAGSDSANNIAEMIARAHNHAEQLNLGKTIVDQLMRLKILAEGYSDTDWTKAKRSEVGHQLSRIFNTVAGLAVENQRAIDAEGFKSDPDGYGVNAPQTAQVGG